MITIPTTELVGLLTDTIPFALDNPEWPEMCCVRLHWDGELLHTQAHDGTHLAWSSWHPGDAPDRDAQESLTEPWGGGDDPWSVVVALADAKYTVKSFKLKGTQAYTPLRVTGETGDLRVERVKARGVPGVATTIDLAEVEFPDLPAVIAKAGGSKAVDSIAFIADSLAHFAQVRPRGPMEVMFTGPDSPAVVTIGPRFVGAIQPTRLGAELKAVA